MQEVNQPFSGEEEDEGGFNFDPNASQEQPDEYYQEPRHRRPEALGPIRTGGVIQLPELQGDDRTSDPYLGRDAAVSIEGELRQFD